MLRDIDHFQSRLSGLDGFEDAGEYLRSIAKAKEVAAPEPPPAPAPTPAAAPGAEGAEGKTSSEKTEQPDPEAEKPASEPTRESNGNTEAKASGEVAAQAG